jgi:hypothetical protein
MSKIDEYFAKFHVQGEITWPDQAETRDRLASDLLGAEIVSSLDNWVDGAVDFVRNRTSTKEFPRKNLAWEHDVSMRAGLAGLSPDQQNAVIRLVAETASGVLFSALVAFDQCPAAEIRVEAYDLDTAEKLASILPGHIDFHDRLYEWIADFSEIPERYDPNAPAG